MVQDVTNNSVFISTRYPVNANLIDDDIYMDTNSIMNIYDNKDNLATNNLKRFIGEVNNNNSTLYYSQHSLDEMISVLHKNYQQRFKDTNGIANIKDISKEDSKIIFSDVYEDVIIFEEEILNEISTKISFDNDEVDELKYNLSLRTGMAIPDSKHIAIAKTNGIHSILTDDKDFIVSEDLNIYGSSHAIHQAFLTNRPKSLLKFN
ncbi:PIN domain-containing protein [Macrococcoides canis]|nr:PIN domain-containing protein [Macrococcus canis]